MQRLRRKKKCQREVNLHHALSKLNSHRIQSVAFDLNFGYQLGPEQCTCICDSPQHHTNDGEAITATANCPIRSAPPEHLSDSVCAGQQTHAEWDKFYCLSVFSPSGDCWFSVT